MLLNVLKLVGATTTVFIKPIGKAKQSKMVVKIATFIDALSTLWLPPVGIFFLFAHFRKSNQAYRHQHEVFYNHVRRANHFLEWYISIV